MNNLVLFKDLSENLKRERNIYISKEFKVANNVQFEANVCLLGCGSVGENSIIHSNTSIENSTIGDNVIIKSSEIEDSFVDNFSTIGPFAHIKANTKIGKNCRIGNFVEIKNSIIGDRSKIAHLTYVGDAQVGKNVNIGCGVVFCNYNGKIKQKTIVGNNVFIGSNVNLIAPLKIEDDVYIAAGSTINKDIKTKEFAIARSRQENKTNFKNPYLDK